MATEVKDRWDKADVVLKPVGGLLTALAVALVGIFGSRYLNQRQADETNIRLYAQIMSSREAADTSLRQQMFNSIISTFLDPQNRNGNGVRPEEKVLAVELLAYNFHDALDIGPLFQHLEYELTALQPDGTQADADSMAIGERKEELEKRLVRVAREVTGKQIAALEDVGVVREDLLFFDDLDQHPEGVELRQEVLGLPAEAAYEADEPQRRFTLWALQASPERKELKVRLEVWPVGATKSEADLTFSVGYFDFPMIDNVRLAHGQRAAVVLKNWAPGSAKLALVYFPGSRASLKEKPYYDEVVEELVRAQRRLGSGDR
jgi:hypothetical protein